MPLKDVGLAVAEGNDYRICHLRRYGHFRVTIGLSPMKKAERCKV